jgi:hypothetical protein
MRWIARHGEPCVGRVRRDQSDSGFRHIRNDRRTPIVDKPPEPQTLTTGKFRRPRLDHDAFWWDPLNVNERRRPQQTEYRPPQRPVAR